MTHKSLVFLMVLALGVFVGLGVHAQPDDNFQLSIGGPGTGPVGGVQDFTFDFDDPNGADIAGWSWGICETTAILHVTAVELGSTGMTINGGDEPAFNAPAILSDGWTVGVVINFFGENPLPPGTGYELHIGTYDLQGEGLGTLNYCDTLGSPTVETVLVDSNGMAVTPATTGAMIEVVPIPPSFFRYDAGTYDTSVGASFSAALSIEEDAGNPGFPQDTQGFSLGLMHDSSVLTATAVNPLDALDDLDGGTGPDFFGPAILGDGITCGVVYEFLGGIFIQYDTLIPVVGVDYDVIGGPGITPLTWVDTLGSPPVENVVVVEGMSQVVEFVDGTVDIGLETAFIRADCNSDGIVNIADGIFILNNLFQMGPEGPCAEACNANGDDMGTTVADAMFVFLYRLMDGSPPPAPFPGCGPVPGADCGSYANCP